MVRLIRKILHALLVLSGALLLTLAFFLVLPLMQSITQRNNPNMLVRAVDAAIIQPPDMPEIEEEQPPEEEPEPETPPELQEESQPLDLSQLDNLLGGGLGDGLLQGDFIINIENTIAEANEMEALFSMSDLDQKPRVLVQNGPAIDARMRRKLPGRVVVIFIVEANGRVEDAQVQSASDPIFERPAINAVKQWKFEPGKRNGEAVRFRMRSEVIFPESE